MAARAQEQPAANAAVQDETRQDGPKRDGPARHSKRDKAEEKTAAEEKPAPKPPKPYGGGTPLDVIMHNKLWTEAPTPKDFVLENRQPVDQLKYQPTVGNDPERPKTLTKDELKSLRSELEDAAAHNAQAVSGKPARKARSVKARSAEARSAEAKSAEAKSAKAKSAKAELAKKSSKVE